MNETLLQSVSALRAELASMRQCFEAADRERGELRARAERAEHCFDAADRERSGLRARAERAEAERDALRAALELYRGQVDQTGRHSAAEAIERAMPAAK